MPFVGLEHELIWENDAGSIQLRVKPFFRWDAHDEHHTHFDLREASAVYLANGSNASWSSGTLCTRTPATRDRWSGTTKDEYRMQRIDFCDRKDAVPKTLTYHGYQEYQDEYWRPDRMSMENHQNDKSTDLFVQAVGVQRGT